MRPTKANVIYEPFICISKVIVLTLVATWVG